MMRIRRADRRGSRWRSLSADGRVELELVWFVGTDWVSRARSDRRRDAAQGAVRPVGPGPRPDRGAIVAQPLRASTSRPQGLPSALVADRDRQHRHVHAIVCRVHRETGRACGRKRTSGSRALRCERRRGPVLVPGRAEREQTRERTPPNVRTAIEAGAPGALRRPRLDAAPAARPVRRAARLAPRGSANRFRARQGQDGGSFDNSSSTGFSTVSGDAASQSVFLWSGPLCYTIRQTPSFVDGRGRAFAREV